MRSVDVPVFVGVEGSGDPNSGQPLIDIGFNLDGPVG